MIIQTEKINMGSKKNRIRDRVNLINRFTYKEFKEKHPDVDITLTEFTDILKESNKQIRGYILENPLGFKLPYSLGYIAVDKFKGLENYIAIDWPATRKLGKKIPILNLHSFGYYYKISDIKNKKKIPFLLYKMEAHRILKRMLAKKIKDGESRHISLDRSYFNRRIKLNNKLKNTEIG